MNKHTHNYWSILQSGDWSSILILVVVVLNQVKRQADLP